MSKSFAWRDRPTCCRVTVAPWSGRMARAPSWSNTEITTMNDKRTALQPLRPSLTWPLMNNNIVRDDLDALIEFLRQDNPILTQSTNVRAFECEWSEWLGV